MHAHFWLLPFAASLMFSGTAGAVEPELIVPEIVNAASQFGGKGIALLGRSFGFSPFMEEGLVRDLSEMTSRKFPPRIGPAYLIEFGATSD